MHLDVFPVIHTLRKYNQSADIFLFSSKNNETLKRLPIVSTHKCLRLLSCFCCCSFLFSDFNITSGGRNFKSLMKILYICTNIEVYFISDIYCNPMMKSLVYFYSLNVCFILWKLYASGTNAAYTFESLNKILNSFAISNFGWIFHVRVSLFFSKSLVVSLAHTIIHSNIDSTEQTKYCSIWQRFPVKRQFQ